MINKVTIKYFRVVTITVFLFLVTSETKVFSQSMCRLKTVNLEKAQGRVLYDEPNADDNVEIKLKLYTIGDTEREIADTKINQKGFFKFEKVPKGEYRLGIFFFLNGVEVIPRYDLILKIKKSNRKKSKKYVTINLNIDCNQTIVNVVKLKSNSQIWCMEENQAAI